MDEQDEVPAAPGVPGSGEASGSGSGPAESRRGFLKVLGISGVGAGVGAGAAIPVAAAVAHPFKHETTSGGDVLIEVGNKERFKEGEPPVKVDLFADRVDAWNRIQNVKVGAAWVFNEGGKLTAFSSVCPHLGCTVDFHTESSRFNCACHRTWFAKAGEVLEGPSQRGLDQLDVEEKDGKVSIRYQRFKLGVSNKEPA